MAKGIAKGIDSPGFPVTFVRGSHKGPHDRPMPHQTLDRPQPFFLYGTAWKEDDTQRCVKDALEAGFRGIDTANQRKHYHEAGVGAALRSAYDRGLVKREELFLQTKFTSRMGQDHRLPYDPRADYATQVRQSFESSTAHLHTDTLDSYVLHGPAGARGLVDDDWEVWQAMEQLHRDGRAGALGVSNVTLPQLEELLADAEIPPRFVQNRCFAARGWDRDIRALCRTRDIVYQGFSLLTANGRIATHPAFTGIVARSGHTAAQVVFRFAQQLGMLPLTGTTDPQHMREDLNCVALDLATSDLEALEALAG